MGSIKTDMATTAAVTAVEIRDALTEFGIKMDFLESMTRLLRYKKKHLRPTNKIMNTWTKTPK
jgi:hypothetical protein